MLLLQGKRTLYGTLSTHAILNIKGQWPYSHGSSPVWFSGVDPEELTREDLFSTRFANGGFLQTESWYRANGCNFLFPKGSRTDFTRFTAPRFPKQDRIPGRFRRHAYDRAHHLMTTVQGLRIGCTADFRHAEKLCRYGGVKVSELKPLIELPTTDTATTSEPPPKRQATLTIMPIPNLRCP